MRGTLPVEACQLLENRETEALRLVRPGVPRQDSSHSKGRTKCVPKTDRGLGVWVPPKPERGDGALGCAVASGPSGKDTLPGGVWGQDPGRRAGAGETPGLPEARAARPSTPSAPQDTVGHAQDRFCSTAEGGEESSGRRSQEKQVF